MEKLVYKLPVFEGPLDVLLFLISKNKLDICDIPIAGLLDQYLAYLSGMREMDLDVTSEFLDMASRLVQIKSAMLLPRHEEEDDDPRSELVRALIEYKTCKAMAEILRGRCEGFDAFVREPAPIEHDDGYRGVHDPRALFDALLSVKGKIKRRQPPPASAFGTIVTGRIVSVTSRIVHVVRRLMREGSRPLRTLFEDAKGRSEAVATFLAVLELIKSRRIAVEEDGAETVKIIRGVR